jgi:predicted permease
MNFLRSLLHRRRVESEMDAELRFHIESLAGDLRKQGLSEEQARRRARLEFGAIEAKKEECRESLGLRLFDELRADTRYALRMMKQTPGFTAVAVISLGLGIGANTAIFTFAQEILLKTMAVPHADRLRIFTWQAASLTHFPGPAWGSFGRGLAAPFPYPLYLEIERHNDVMEDIVAFKDVYKLTATVDGHAEPVDAMLVSGNFYPALAPKIIAGRAIAPSDDRPSSTPVLIISDAYWARRFGRSAGALGKTINLNRVPVTIIGVNSPEFEGAKAGGRFEVFLPICLQPQVIPQRGGSLLASNNFWWVMMMGRLHPGITDRAANTALDAAFQNAVHATIPEKPQADIPRFSLSNGSRGLDIRSTMFTQPIYILLSLSGLVLLIACANLANLLLARSANRQREMSLRLALGASRSRVMRQVLTEAMLLAVFGGSAGLLLGYLGRNLIPNLFDSSWHPSGINPQMDWRVFAFAFVITALTGLLFGVAPAWRSTRADVNSGLKETGRMTTTRPKAFLGKALVVFQVSLSLLLLIGAGLFVRTLLNLRTTTLGFHPEHLLLFDLHPPKSRYAGEHSIALFQQVAEKMSALPGVQAATLSSEPLIADSASNSCFRPAGAPPPPEKPDNQYINSVGPTFFETMGIPIIYGRAFTSRDDRRAPKVAIINQRLAHDFFSNASPIGQTISSCDADATALEVVGVTADAKYYSIRDEVPPTVYLPYLQEDDANQLTFELKTSASTASIVAEIRDAVRSIDKDLPLLEVRTQTQQIEATLSNERVFATLTSGFGLLALILASIGIYGIMSYTVSRRTNEIGIRMALGARSIAVLKMILRETILLALIGIVIGLTAAAALTRLAASMLYNLKPTDPLTFLAAAFLLTLIALASGLIPARRAASVDPMNALRHE